MSQGWQEYTGVHQSLRNLQFSFEYVYDPAKGLHEVDDRDLLQFSFEYVVLMASSLLEDTLYMSYNSLLSMSFEGTGIYVEYKRKRLTILF